MEILRKRAYARAGLVGNPSDGYNGKTISVSIRNFYAEAVLYEWEDVEVVSSQEDNSRFRSVRDLVDDVTLHGYYGGIRLVKATIKRFVEYCDREGHKLHDRNFSVRYTSTIPRQVGLAGSSAIVVATIRVLMEFFHVEIPAHILASLVLSVEAEELGIAAGLQDRVIQVYEGLVSMDFAREAMTTEQGFLCGKYERLNPDLLPPLYVAYSDDFSEPTEVFHNNLRARYNSGDAAVVGAMSIFAGLAAEGREAILSGDAKRLSRLMDKNFDTRHSICQLPKRHIEMVETARSAGASGKFAGSGGAIIGTYEDADMFAALKEKLEGIGCKVIKPTVT